MDQPVAIRFDEETRFKLHLLARETGRSRADLVADAVRQFVDTEIAAMIVQGKLHGNEDAGDPDRANFADGWNIVV